MPESYTPAPHGRSPGVQGLWSMGPLRRSGRTTVGPTKIGQLPNARPLAWPRAHYCRLHSQSTESGPRTPAGFHRIPLNRHSHNGWVGPRFRGSEAVKIGFQGVSTSAGVSPFGGGQNRGPNLARGRWPNAQEIEPRPKWLQAKSGSVRMLAVKLPGRRVE